MAAVSHSTDVCWKYWYDDKRKSNGHSRLLCLTGQLLTEKCPRTFWMFIHLLYVIQRLALWQNHCHPECRIFFFITAVAYPSNFSICNATCMFQMIWWHLLLSMLCAHAAYTSTGDAICALELLQPSQVKWQSKLEHKSCVVFNNFAKNIAQGVGLASTRDSLLLKRHLPFILIRSKNVKCWVPAQRTASLPANGFTCRASSNS